MQNSQGKLLLRMSTDWLAAVSYRGWKSLL